METAPIERSSPVSFAMAPEQLVLRGDWPVVLRYPHEGAGPWLVDLSHGGKWDFQSAALDRLAPRGVVLPERPGACACAQGILCSRLNPTQAVAWHIAGPVPSPPDTCDVTDVTDAVALLGLVGPKLLPTLEKLTALDFVKPARAAPFILQGPVAHVPSRVVCFATPTAAASALIISCARGYARDMVDALLEAGKEFGLRPAGELAWTAWIDTIDYKKEAA
ncbi:MAG: sarcosine oxidase subunit gamma SoxG [Desulfatitalea sp.]|nr:sarcosine oxidase subunit gamma SoxG [Desulfatitalea sp.]